MPNHPPRLTTALRELGSLSRDFENDEQGDEDHELPSCAIEWSQLHVILRKSCIDSMKLKKMLHQLLQHVSKIVGEEVHVETRKQAATTLFVEVYQHDKISYKLLNQIKEGGVADHVTWEELEKLHKIAREMMGGCSSEEKVTSAIQHIITQPRDEMFGDKIKFSPQLPSLYDADDDDSDSDVTDDEDDAHGRRVQEIMEKQMADVKQPSVDQPKHPQANKPAKCSSACPNYQWMVDVMNKKFGDGSNDMVDMLMSIISSDKDDSLLQEELYNLLGDFDVVCSVLQNRQIIVKESKVLAAMEQQLSNGSTTRKQMGGTAVQVSILTSSEKEMDRYKRKEEKKLKKIIDKNCKSGSNPSPFDVEQMIKQRAEELNSPFADSQRYQSMFEKRRSENRNLYPHVYDSQKLNHNMCAALLSGQKMVLPEGFTRVNTNDYEAIKLPASKSLNKSPWPQVHIEQLDQIGRQAFKGVTKLNTIQSCVFESAYTTNENMLICAPTGAGKTNVAMLTIVREIIQNIENGILKKDAFKIIYIAPMKALACEMAANFGKRLAPLGITVRELTGDTQLSKAEIAKTQMMVVTPEKWDVVTRKSTGDVSLARLVKLLIIDEVHLLHDERGPVLETLVARTLRQVEQQQSMIRIIGLSATLPNYLDVAKFLRVNPKQGLFFFDGRFRPVPLQLNFVGVKSLSKMKAMAQMDQACYDTVVDNLKRQEQILVFVHARNATASTGKMLASLSRKNGQTSLFTNEQLNRDGYDDACKHVTRSRNKIVQDLFRQGIGIHHAGMLRSDRLMMEKFFTKGYIRVLCCTATLAWGINLPAHAVVIKGTQYYDAKQGQFVDVGILDVQQIFGRAGRPQFDTTGEATIVTQHENLSKYLRRMTNQDPIESQFVDRLIDNLNAEVALGTVCSLEEATKWLSYTYLYQRIRQNPLVYGISYNEYEQDRTLTGWQRDLCRVTARSLDKLKMIRFNEQNGYLSPTDLGRSASNFYIKYESIQTFSAMLNPNLQLEGIVNMVCQSSEFQQFKVRDDELNELDELKRHYCPVSNTIIAEDACGKASILFQTFVSNGYVDNFSLASDLMYIQQNASRIVRALFDIVLKQGMARLAAVVLKLCKCVDRRMWPWDSELRQFGPRLSKEVLYKIEQAKLDVTKMRDMTSGDIGNVLRHPSIGGKVKHCVDEMPHVTMEATVQPITRSILKITLTITPQFRWNNHAHGSTHEPFWIWVEDTERDDMYHSEYFLLNRKQVLRGEAQEVVFTIPLQEPLPTQYMVYMESDRWLGATAVCPITFHHLILPESHPPNTSLLDLDPLPTTALEEKRFVDIYPFTHFNPIQTQIFHTLYHNDTNVLLGAPTGSGKTVAAELSLFRMLRTQPNCKAVYIAPLKALVRERMKDWEKRIVKQLDIKLVELTGDIAPDMKAVARADVIITTPEKWDGISRSWSTRGYVKQVSLIIIDEIHLLGQDRGPVLEVIVSRTNFISSQTNKQVRIVGLSTALANARDLADWLGIKQMGLFNFRASTRPVPMEVHIQGFPGKQYCPRMALMNKPCYQTIKMHSPEKPTLIFVSSRRQTRLTALDLIAYLAAENNPKQWLNMDEEELEELCVGVKDPNLRFTLSFGIGMHHAGLMERDRSLVERLFGDQKIQTLIATSTLAWGVNLPAHLVIVKGTEFFDGKTNRYKDYPITDVLQMMGRAGRPQFDDKAVAMVLVHDVKKSYYRRFMYEPFPVESSLLEVVQDHLNAEVVAGTICNTQEAIDYLTWTYFFRRLLMNPSYYGLVDCEHESVNKFLSKLLQQAISVLRISSCLMSEDEEDPNMLEATNFGRIASYYYLNHLTMRLLNDEMRSEMAIDEVLELLSNVHEYNELPVRHNEDHLNMDLAQQLPSKHKWQAFDLPSTKTLLLLHAHFARHPLPSTDYSTDLKSVLDQAVRLLQAFVDASADRGWAVTSLRCMHVIQMMTQASWHHKSDLLTLPEVKLEEVTLLQRNIEGEMKIRPSLASLANVVRTTRGAQELTRVINLSCSNRTSNKIIEHLTKLPLVSVNLKIRLHHLDDVDDGDVTNEWKPISKSFGRSLLEKESWESVRPGCEYMIGVNLRRVATGNHKFVDDKALAPRFPKPKLEGWFLMLCNRDNRQLIALKRVNTLRSSANENLVFYTPEQPTKVVLSLMLVSDSYIGLDQNYEIRLQVEE